MSTPVLIKSTVELLYSQSILTNQKNKYMKTLHTYTEPDSSRQGQAQEFEPWFMDVY